MRCLWKNKADSSPCIDRNTTLNRTYIWLPFGTDLIMPTPPQRCHRPLTGRLIMTVKQTLLCLMLKAWRILQLKQKQPWQPGNCFPDARRFLSVLMDWKIIFEFRGIWIPFLFYLINVDWTPRICQAFRRQICYAFNFSLDFCLKSQLINSKDSQEKKKVPTWDI